MDDIKRVANDKTWKTDREVGLYKLGKSTLKIEELISKEEIYDIMKVLYTQFIQKMDEKNFDPQKIALYYFINKFQSPTDIVYHVNQFIQSCVIIGKIDPHLRTFCSIVGIKMCCNGYCTHKLQWKPDLTHAYLLIVKSLY